MKNQDKIKNNNTQSLSPLVPQSLIKDIFVALLCITGSFLCARLFYIDLNKTLSRINEQPIATVTFRYNTAQRRFMDRLMWDRLQNGSFIYNGDVIRTADLSEATISFTHGDIVNLFSNTLIQIFADSTGSRLDFSSGDISVNASSDLGMVIVSQDIRVTVDSGSVVRAAALEDTEQGIALDITVSEGSAVLETVQNTEAQVIEAGSALILNTAGEALPLPQAAPVSPLPDTRIITSSSLGAQVNFSWNKINYTAIGLTRLEISYDRSFTRILFAEDTIDSRINYTLPPGTWFWRLYPAQTEPREASFSRITVVHSPPPELITPANGQTISYRTRLPQIRFQWTASEQVQSYVLEAADNPAMQNPFLHIQTRAAGGDQLSAVTSNLAAGIWYWRITPEYGGGFTGAVEPSAMQSFIIEQRTPLAAPVLTAPAENAVLNIETGRRDILFSWRRENEAASYTIRIAANRDMSNPIIEQTLTDTFYRYGAAQTSITPGTWYWTVQQTASDNEASPQSQPRSFTAMQGEIVQRLVFPPDSYTVADNLLSDMRFTWRTNLTQTRFQLSQDPDFNRLIIDESAPSESFSVRTLPGESNADREYFWRITGIPFSGAQLMESPVRRLTVAAALPPPVLEVTQGAAIVQGDTVVLNQGQPLEFSWRSSADTEYYAFQLVLLDDQENPIFEAIVHEPHISINMDDYDAGSYMWSVQGLTRENSTTSRRTGLAAMQPITIRQVKPVTLDYPHNGREYLGVDASRRPDTVRWSSQDAPYNAEFILARNADMTDIVFTRQNASREVNLGRLPAGNYYWTVRAQNADGIDISALSPSHFRVLPIPLLPAVQNTTPANGHTISVEQIIVSRKIDFSWNRVDGANGYILTVFQGEGAERRTVLQTPVLRATEYTVDDVAQLGRGAFFWHAEAVFVLEDGTIEQRGRIFENKLTVDIPSAGQTRPGNTGALYGN